MAGARDLRDGAAEVVQLAARSALDDDTPAHRRHGGHIQGGARRMDPGDEQQFAYLVRAIEAHIEGLPRRYGDVRSLVISEGEEPIAEFDGGGEAAHDITAFLIMRATMEGRRTQFYVSPQCQVEHGEIRQATRWKFVARPEAMGAGPADPSTAPGSYGAGDAIRLRDAHIHQLIQHLIAQNSAHAQALQQVTQASSETMREVTNTTTGTLKQLARIIESSTDRATSAEERAREAAQDSRTYQSELIEAHRLLEQQLARVENMQADESRGVLNAAVTEVTRGVMRAVLPKGFDASGAGLEASIVAAMKQGAEKGAEKGAEGAEKGPGDEK